MKNVERLLCSGTLATILHARLCWILAAVALPACSNVHGSTETGNPPLIDVNRVALVVTSDDVRIVGDAGAVSPGGVSVEVLIVATGEVVRRASKADGSFEIPLSTSADAVVEVRALVGDNASPTVYVTRGGASVGSGDGASLSCMERTNLASQAAASAGNAADTSCQSAADCTRVSTRTSCTDTCSDSVVARRAQTALEGRIDEIDRTLCANFKSDGCTVLALPCVAPPDGPLACVSGKCSQERMMPVACPSCLNQTVSWGPSSGLTTNTLSGCGTFQRVTRTGPMAGPGCNGEVAHCGTSGNLATVEDLIGALAHPDVEAALAGGTLVGGLPTPGGLATAVDVGDRSFVIANCISGSDCSIPSGVVQLRALLERIASETSCQPAACPPNAIYISDYCLSCGPAGGCAQSEGRCAIVCSDSSQCASNTPGTTCSPRGVCELTGCI